VNQASAFMDRGGKSRHLSGSGGRNNLGRSYRIQKQGEFVSGCEEMAEDPEDGRHSGKINMKPVVASNERKSARGYFECAHLRTFR
jgi:hypothetical protein